MVGDSRLVSPGVLVDAIQQVGYQASFSMEEVPTSLGGKFTLEVRAPLSLCVCTRAHVHVRACVVVFCFPLRQQPHQTFGAPFQIGGMSCASCSSTVKSALQGVPGVEKALVNVMTQKATGESIPSVASSCPPHTYFVLWFFFLSSARVPRPLCPWR